ncbi:MAG TPA: type II toxin-antitoxin system RatA family toxin [Gammaproteobacteria bacterium]|nr:type II toxin-antitoxin system RatA family toxin [Gammaproteobacteria bacterium]
MPVHHASRTLPWSCEQLFDLAADVERYPEYLPGWVSAEVVDRSENRLQVRQQLGLPGLQCPFVSVAELQRPRSVLVRSQDGPFRHLRIEWRFEAHRSGRCRVSLTMEYRLRNPLLEGVAATLFSRSATNVMERFAARAAAICKSPSAT